MPSSTAGSSAWSGQAGASKLPKPAVDVGYDVAYSKRADKDLDSLPSGAGDDLRRTLESYAADPLRFRCDVKKMRAFKKRLRIRRGNYRVIFDVNDKDRLFEVKAADDRKDIY